MTMNVGVKDFKSFLPKDLTKVEIAKVWDLIPRLKRDKTNLSNKRFSFQ